MFGLMAEPITESAGDPSVKTNGIFHTVNAFLDQLDEIWRGPPPTLWHVAHYIESIVLLAPRYRLASHNCYYFARLLMYVIGLRHYSFPCLASSKPQDLAVRSVRHDPSGISMLFRFLRAEEESNGVLLYARLMKFTTWSSVVLLAGGVIGSGSYICTRVDIFTPIFAFLLMGSFIFGALLWEVMSKRMHSLMIEPCVRSLRAEVESLVVKLGVKLESLVHWSTHRDTVIFSTYRYGHSYHLPKWTARGLQVARIFGAKGGKGGATAQ